ncbi:GNAT family N-acetyltransferase [Motilibacter aurantiacus]|uniref:GNAT family N-acetyltransferase n=1 Tax=Motilibacter aurantiacus TaxID=2714955 RepID=UPI001407727F|nr:GNAT family N-acetyltransferase [Motilibacter aurantiacus]NHC45592.1 GNAT family N-acetyltransferase [Motilibacter aurantiacus]
MPVRLTVLADPHAGALSRRVAWVADADGVPLGTAFLRLFDRPGQDHLAELTMTVHPAERRRGVGTRLLGVAVEAARAEGRGSLLAQADAGSAGDAFCAAHGFRRVLTLVYARLAMAEADVGLVDALAGRPHAGYRLVWWEGAVPDNLAVAFTAARPAMDDMPTSEADFGTVSWDVEGVRAAAAAIERRGDVLHTVAAVSEADGSVAGFTELVVPGDGAGDAQHYGTAVVREHRGNGLGRWLKAASIRIARDRYPRLEGLLTDTADSNAPMMRINAELGYAPTHTTYEYQRGL